MFFVSKLIFLEAVINFKNLHEEYKCACLHSCCPSSALDIGCWQRKMKNSLFKENSACKAGEVLLLQKNMKVATLRFLSVTKILHCLYVLLLLSFQVAVNFYRHRIWAIDFRRDARPFGFSHKIFVFLGGHGLLEKNTFLYRHSALHKKIAVD